MNDLRKLHADRKADRAPGRRVGRMVPGLAGVLMFSLSLTAGAESVTGRVESADRYHLDFGVGGEVVPPGVRPGDQVKAGTVLLRLDEGPFRADLEAAAAEMVWKEALLEEANRAWERDNELYEEGSLSQVELDLGNIRRLEAESAYRRSVADHAASESRLRGSRIIAPVPGIVLKVLALPGDRVNPANASRPALVLGSASTVVRATIDPGAAVPPVGATVALVVGDRATSGRVVSVLPGRRGKGLVLTVEGGDGLPPLGGPVEIRF